MISPNIYFFHATIIQMIKILKSTTCTTFTPCWFSFKSRGDIKICKGEETKAARKNLFGWLSLSVFGLLEMVFYSTGKELNCQVFCHLCQIKCISEGWFMNTVGRPNGFVSLVCLQSLWNCILDCSDLVFSSGLEYFLLPLNAIC